MTHPAIHAFVRAFLVLAVAFCSFGVGSMAADGMSGLDWIVAGCVAQTAFVVAVLAASDRLAVRGGGAQP